MYYCYILECNDNNRYVGATNNLKNRLQQHGKGKVYSTKNKRPLKLVYYEKFQSQDRAYRRERSLKNGRTRKAVIERLIQNFPKEKLLLYNQ